MSNSDYVYYWKLVFADVLKEFMTVSTPCEECDTPLREVRYTHGCYYICKECAKYHGGKYRYFRRFPSKFRKDAFKFIGRLKSHKLKVDSEVRKLRNVLKVIEESELQHLNEQQDKFKLE